MGCCGGDRGDKELRNDVKWEYVNFDDFKSTSCWTPFAYAYLWIMLFVSISVYAVDTFTAINLIIFNKWSGQVKPWLDFKYSRWIYAGCIILSFVLLIYRWARALKVMKGGTVAKSYLDPLAVRIQSVRTGSEGRGWKRFLVFAELTKSRKGADYVALFAYYSFEAWLRICFAEGPRQVVNGMTLYSVMTAKLIPKGDHAAEDGNSSFVQFWKNIGILADDNNLQAVILFGMLWTMIIWVLAAISLALSVILYLIFLWHHIPSDAGGLTGYCRSKINKRMQRIVRTKTDKALKKENELRARQEAQAFREGFTDVKRQPTLPDLGGSPGPEPSLPPLSRQTTMTTLPEYTSRPGTARSDDTLPPMPPPGDGFRPGPKRHMTNASDASWSSYNSNAPLMASAGDIGYSPADRTPSSAVSTPWSARPGPPNRSFTGMSEFSDRSFTPGPPRPPTSNSGRHTPGAYQMEPLARPGTSASNPPRNLRISADSDTLPPPISRHQTPVSASSTNAPMLLDPQGRRTPAGPNNPYFPPVSPIPESNGRETPAFRSQTPVGPPMRPYSPAGAPSYRPFTPAGGPPSRPYSPAGGPPPRTFTPGPQPPPLPRVQTSSSVYSGEYMAFNSSREHTPSPGPASATDSNVRSFSRPMPRSNTPQTSSNLAPTRPAPPQRDGSVEDILDSY